MSRDCRFAGSLLWLSPSLLGLTACGGGGIGSPLADAIPLIAACALRNCTESTTLRVDELSLRFTATQNEGESTLVVSGFLSKSANVTTTVLIAPNESLSASVDGGPETALRNVDNQRLDWALTLPATSATPRVQLVFTRDGVRHVSDVVMPPTFSVVQPSAGVALNRSAGNVLVQLSPSATSSVAAFVQGHCTRNDASSFEVASRSLAVRAEPGVAAAYRIDALPLDQDLNRVSQGANGNNPNTALVSRCDLTVTWDMSASGTTAATLSRYSVFSASRRASQTLAYDARS